MTHDKIPIKYCIAPKWRFILLILVSSLSFILYDWRFYLINLGITFVISLLMDIPYDQLCKPIRSNFYLLIIMFAMYIIRGDWVDGIKVMLRFCNIVIFTSWLLCTTSHLAIIEGLVSLCKPLAYIGLQPVKVGLALTLTIRFIPLIMDTFKQVKIAQKAKGIDQKFWVILIPSIIKIIKIADDIAEAIEARS